MNISLSPWALAQLDARAKLLGRSRKEDIETILQNEAALWSWCTPGASLDQYINEVFMHELALHINDLEIEIVRANLIGADQIKGLAELEKELESSLETVKRLRAVAKHKPKPKLTLVKPEPVT